MFVYVIVNSETLKIYIGKTTQSNLNYYLKTKFRDAASGRYRGRSRLFASMQKYPSTVWSIHSLFEGTTDEEICKHEKLLIKTLGTQNLDIGYNICDGGEGKAAPHSEEWKSKMKESWAKKRAHGYKHPPSPLAIDMTGMVVNGIQVLSKFAETKNRTKRAHWLCRCHCGKTFTTLGASLRSGNTKSCGCIQVESLQGQKFGRLTVIELSPTRKGFAAVWVCRCDCGNVKNIRAAHLKNGGTKSCGCLVYEPRQFSEEHRRKLNEAAKIPFSKERRRKISAARKGKPGKRHSLESRLKMSETQKGRISPMKGKRHSLETRRKMSQAAQGNSWNKGRHHSPEAVLKMSEAAKRRYAKPDSATN